MTNAYLVLQRCMDSTQGVTVLEAWGSLPEARIAMRKFADRRADNAVLYYARNKQKANIWVTEDDQVSIGLCVRIQMEGQKKPATRARFYVKLVKVQTNVITRLAGLAEDPG